MAIGARFCGSWGAATRVHARTVHRRSDRERQRTGRAALALGIACGGPLLGVFGAARVFEEAEGPWPLAIAGGATMLLSAIATALVQGEWRSAAPFSTSWRWWAAAVPAGAVTLVAAIAYVAVLPIPDSARQPVDATAAAWFAVVAMAPLTEELLCRGAAWRAAVTLASPHVAITLTAVLFAFLHGLNGVYLLELPHRFAMGLVLGWLRWRSGSVAPPIVAHALHNLGALQLIGN